MINLMTQPSVTAARLLFQQCVAASSQEGSSLEFIKNEISGYLLEKVEPVKLHQNVWKKTLDSISSSKKVRKEMILDPFYNNLPLVLQEFLSKKKVKWKNFFDVKIVELHIHGNGITVNDDIIFMTHNSHSWSDPRISIIPCSHAGN